LSAANLAEIQEGIGAIPIQTDVLSTENAIPFSPAALDESSTKIKAATEIFAKFRGAKLGEGAAVTPSAKIELEKAAKLFLEGRDLVLTPAGIPHPEKPMARYVAPAALISAAEVFLHLHQTVRGQEQLARASDELQRWFKNSPGDEKAKEMIDRCGNVQAEAIELEKRLKGNPLTMPPNTNSGPSLKLAGAPKETVKLVEDAAEEPVLKSKRKPVTQFWFGNVILVGAMLALAFYGVASGKPHQILASTGVVGDLLRKIVPHTLKGSSIAAFVSGLLWYFWQRKYVSHLVLSSKSHSPKGLGLRVVLFGSVTLMGFYLGDAIYHLMR
jgi:hypothetical protein